MAAADLDEPMTESRGADVDLDLLTSRELVELMNVEDASVAPAVRATALEIADMIDAIVERLVRGGRLVYVGAGSSGQIAALDADECETTFSAPPGQVVALVAGAGLSSAAERDAAEDDGDAGRRDVGAATVGSADVVIGISASGRTPYVLGAIEAAVATGALAGARRVCARLAPLGACRTRRSA